MVGAPVSWTNGRATPSLSETVVGLAGRREVLPVPPSGAARMMPGPDAVYASKKRLREKSCLLCHSGVDGYELDPGLDLLFRAPGKAFGIELVLRAVHGQCLVIDLIEPAAGERFR